MRLVDFTGKSVGMIYAEGHVAYRPRSDLLLFNCQRPLSKPCFKGIDPSRLIITYYYWDNQYDKFNTPEKWTKWLQNWKDQGVDKMAFVDFSTWFSEPRQKRHDTIQRAFDYMAEASDAGYSLVWNNNLSTTDFDYFKKLLPAKIPTYIVSANHHEDVVNQEALHVARGVYETMVTEKKSRRIIMITGRITHTATPWFFDGRTTLDVIPTARKWQTLVSRELELKTRAYRASLACKTEGE